MGGTTLSSLDMERLARHGLLEYGEFEVELSEMRSRMTRMDKLESS